MASSSVCLQHGTELFLCPPLAGLAAGPPPGSQALPAPPSNAPGLSWGLAGAATHTPAAPALPPAAILPATQKKPAARSSPAREPPAGPRAVQQGAAAPRAAASAAKVLAKQAGSPTQVAQQAAQQEHWQQAGEQQQYSIAASWPPYAGAGLPVLVPVSHGPWLLRAGLAGRVVEACS